MNIKKEASTCRSFATKVSQLKIWLIPNKGIPNK